MVSAADEPRETPQELLAQADELRENKQYRDALSAYEKYLRVAEGLQERYFALLHAASCADELGLADRALDFAFKMLRLDACRAEGFTFIGRHYYQLEEWAHAVPYLVAATTRQAPADGMRVEADYTWRPWDLLSVCYYRLGEYRESIEASLRALDGNPEYARVIENMNWAIKGLAALGPPPPPQEIRFVLPKSKKT